MTIEKQLLKDTKKLKKLISQVNNSGISAWDAGNLLKEVKERKGYIKEFGDFDNYTKTEVGVVLLP